jgi:protein-tyrosine-phosphatase
LRQLRDGGLVSARRSAADRRDSYYRIDLVACRGAWHTAGAALHPALHPAQQAPALPPDAGEADHRPRVLFLCTGNSARSQMAEALLQHLSGGTVEARSAGSHPKQLHPNAVRVLRRRGIDISANRTKHFAELVGERFDQVITLCDRVREVCPELPSHPERVHWSIPDPAAEGATNRASYAAFERTADELETRVTFQLHRLTRPATTRRTQDAQR